MKSKFVMNHKKTILLNLFFSLFLCLFSYPAQAATVDMKNFTVVSIKTTSAVIRWESDEVVGTSQIDYGINTSYGTTTTEEQLSYYHETTLSGLNPGTIYHYRIHSKDYDNNATVSTDHTFTTATQGQLEAAFAADIVQRKTQGNVYFVRTDGNDTCNGSQDLSYASDHTNCSLLTIPHAISVAVSGDSIIVMAGDYTLNGQINITTSNISLIGKDMPYIRQANINDRGFVISNANHVTVQGFYLRNMSVGFLSGNAPYLTLRGNDIEVIDICGRTAMDVTSAPHALITDNKIMQSGNGIAAASDDSIITHNTVDIPDHDNYCADYGTAIIVAPLTAFSCGPTFNEWNAPQFCNHGGGGGVISYNKVLASNRGCIATTWAQDIDVHHNLVDNCDHNGIDFHGSYNAKAHSNTILDMSGNQSNSILISSAYQGASWAAGGNLIVAQNISIYNNYIHNKKNGGIFSWGNPYNVTLYDNIIVDEAPGATVSYFADPYNDFPRICHGVRIIDLLRNKFQKSIKQDILYT